jgi:hypothetical protein
LSNILVRLVSQLLTNFWKDFSYNEVNDETAKILVQVIENNPKLKKLELNGNILTKKGIKLIESALDKLTQKEVLGTLSENDSEGISFNFLILYFISIAMKSNKIKAK